MLPTEAGFSFSRSRGPREWDAFAPLGMREDETGGLGVYPDERSTHGGPGSVPPRIGDVRARRARVHRALGSVHPELGNVLRRLGSMQRRSGSMHPDPGDMRRYGPGSRRRDRGRAPGAGGHAPAAREHAPRAASADGSSSARVIRSKGLRTAGTSAWTLASPDPARAFGGLPPKERRRPAGVVLIAENGGGSLEAGGRTLRPRSRPWRRTRWPATRASCS